MNTRVVVADDSAPYLELLVLVLGEEPWVEVVGTARDGVEAVHVALEQRPDAVLLDVDMPRLGGFGAAVQIRRLRPETLLLLHTGAFVEEARRRGEQLDLPVRRKDELAKTVAELAQPPWRLGLTA